jgi:hypothetical protein
MENLWKRIDGCSSLLLQLSPGAPDPTLHPPLTPAEEYRRYAEGQLKCLDMSESNVLLLDYADYKLEDDENWNSMEEVLRIDNIVRSRLGMPLKLKAYNYKQPWSISEEERKPVAKLELHFSFFSKVKIENAHLVMEEPESSNIMLNRQAVTTTPDGWWVDKAIRRLRLSEGCLKEGENALLIKIPFGFLTNVERVYIQGSFGVRHRGRQAILVPHRPDELPFRD